MGCGGSKGSMVDQNQNQPPPPQQQQPVKQPPPQAKPEPKPAPVQPVAPQPRQPPPKEPTPPPPKEPTPPPPKEPTPEPPKEPTPSPPAEETEKLTPEVLKEFTSLEKDIQKLEKAQPEERLMLIKFELKHTEESVKIKESELDAATSVATKEYADCANFNIQEYMTSNQISYLSQQDADAAFDKEKQEYLEAKNKVDSSKKEVDRLNAEIVSLNEKLTESSAKVSELQSLQDKQDGLLENLFNGDYGSELEDQLEAEHDDLRSKRDQLVLVAMKWRSCKDALSKACSQLAYSVARWHQIKEYPDIPSVAKYYMATETRDRLIGGHMNIRHCMEQIQMKLPYWNDSDDKNLVMSVNIIYNDITTHKTFERALAWYKYYHWRAALGLNWVEQVVAQLHQQVGDAERSVREKYTVLKKERLQCIQAKLKETMDVDFDIDELMIAEDENDEEEDPLLMSTIFDVGIDTQENVEEMPAPKENENPTSLEAFAADGDATTAPEEEKPKESDDAPPPESPPEGEEKPAEEKPAEEKPAEETPTEETEDKSKQVDDKPKAPPIKTIPLEDLAPLPSQAELLGKVEKLLESVENAEETLEKNKMKQEQQLQEQLRRRRSRRKRMADQAKNNVQVQQTETIPETEEAKPDTEEAKPETEEAKPETEEPKPKAEEAKTESEDQKPETDEPQEQKPE